MKTYFCKRCGFTIDNSYVCTECGVVHSAQEIDSLAYVESEEGDVQV